MTTQEKIFQLLGSIDARLNAGDEKFQKLEAQVNDIHQSVCHDLTLRVTEIETSQDNHLTAHKVWLSRSIKTIITIGTTIGGYLGWTSRG